MTDSQAGVCTRYSCTTSLPKAPSALPTSLGDPEAVTVANVRDSFIPKAYTNLCPVYAGALPRCHNERRNGLLSVPIANDITPGGEIFGPLGSVMRLSLLAVG